MIAANQPPTEPPIESLEMTIIELSDDELDDVSGGCHRHHGHRHHLGHHHGNQGGHGGGHHLAQSSSDYHKHSLSITGQTITHADGSSVTSFSIQEEDISSHSFQSLSD